MIFLHSTPFAEARTVKSCLEAFYGIGPNVAARLMARNYIHPAAQISSLSNKQTVDLNADLADMNIENDLKREVRDNIKRLREMGAYRGKRHGMGLPVRGQNTQNNIETARRLNRLERKG